MFLRLDYSAGNLTAVKNLIQNGANVLRAKDNRYGWNALHLSAWNGNKKYDLLIFGVWKHQQNYENEMNFNSGHLEVTKYLVEQGLSIEAKDINGRTAIHLFRGQGNWTC